MKTKPVLYSRYPLSSIFIYNGVTVLHFLLGAAGIMIGFVSWWGYLLGAAYLVFAFIEMYVLMPFKVCPNCPYYKLEGSLCISGLNIVSRKIAGEGNVKDFSRRSSGALCPNNLYLAGFILPIAIVIPGLITNFSFLLLGILVLMVGLLVFRFFVLFPKVACGHCRAMHICPNARAMGLGKQQL